MLLIDKTLIGPLSRLSDSSVWFKLKYSTQELLSVYYSTHLKIKAQYWFLSLWLNCFSTKLGYNSPFAHEKTFKKNSKSVELAGSLYLPSSKISKDLVQNQFLNIWLGCL